MVRLYYLITIGAVMRTLRSTLFIVVALAFASCATTQKTGESELAGYTLKNKKELMHQKVLHTKEKTVIAAP